MRIISFLVGFLSFYFLSGQSAEPNGKDSLYEVASDRFVNGEYEEAYRFFKKAGLDYRLSDEFGAYAQCNMYMGLCLTRLGSFSESIELVENTLAYLNDVIPNNDYLYAEGKRILGEAFLNVGRNEKALQLLKEAESMYPDSAFLEKSECYNSLGITYWNNGNRDLAQKYHEQALRIRTDKYGMKSLPAANSYNNLGILDIEDNPLDATIFLNRALRIYQEKFGDVHPQVAYCMINLARAKGNQDLYEEAFELLEQVQQIWERIYPNDHPAKAFTLSALGRLQAQQGNPDQAIHTQESALKMYVKLYGPKHPDVANTYFLIGSYYQQKAEFKLALENYQRSIYANVESETFNSLYDLPSLDSYLNGDYLLSSLMAKAKALEARHLEKTLQPKDLKAAIETYQKADTLVSELRNIRVNEVDKLRLGETARLIYSNGISLTSILTRQPFFGHFHYPTMFNFFERSKSSVLLNAINDTKAKSYGGIPDALLTYEDSLKKEITFIQQKIAQGDDSEQNKERLFKLKTSYNDFIKELEENYPEYYNLKYATSFASLDEIKNYLKEDETLVMYFLDTDQLFQLQVSKSKTHFEEVALPESFFRNISAYRNSLRFKIRSGQIQQELYSSLVPVPFLTEKLIILADGQLNTIPFESIKNPETGRYLIEDHSISYDFSASLMLQRASTEEKFSKDIFLAAPIDFSGHQEVLTNLPGTEEEINELKYLFVSKDRSTDILKKEQAIEPRFKDSSLSKYKYVHLATHGVVDEETPELSRIYLYPNDENDGQLYSGDIYNMTVNADLVTMSACETGLGKIHSGEGIIGLSRALLYSGANNLLVSLWQVSDASTAQLMIDFYKNHLGTTEEINYREALRRAKINMIHSESYPDPYYWAAFVLIGK